MLRVGVLRAKPPHFRTNPLVGPRGWERGVFEGQNCGHPERQADIFAVSQNLDCGYLDATVELHCHECSGALGLDGLYRVRSHSKTLRAQWTTSADVLVHSAWTNCTESVVTTKHYALSGLPAQMFWCTRLGRTVPSPQSQQNTTRSVDYQRRCSGALGLDELYRVRSHNKTLRAQWTTSADVLVHSAWTDCTESAVTTKHYALSGLPAQMFWCTRLGRTVPSPQGVGIPDINATEQLTPPKTHPCNTGSSGHMTPHQAISPPPPVTNVMRSFNPHPPTRSSSHFAREREGEKKRDELRHTYNFDGDMVTERLACSPPTKANQLQCLAGLPDFRKWESCRTMTLVAVSLFAFHQGNPGSIPGRDTPDFRKWESCRTTPLVGGFSREISRFSLPFIPVLLHTHLNHSCHLLRLHRACSQTGYFAMYLLEASLLRFQLQSVHSNELFRKVLTGSLIVTIPTTERAVEPTISQGTYWKPHCYDSNYRACSQTDYFAMYLLEASLLRFQLQIVQSNRLFRKVLTGSLIVTIPTTERAVERTISQGTYWKPHCYDSNDRACSRKNYFARYLLEASLLRFQRQSVQSKELFRKVLTGSLIVTIPTTERAVKPTISQGTYWKPYCYDSNYRACSQTDYFARYLLEASLLRFQLQSVQSNRLFRKVLTGSLIVTIPTTERAVERTISQGTYWKPHCYDSNSRACSQTDYFARYLLEASLLRFQLQSVHSNELFRNVLTGSLIVTIPTTERAVEPTISQGTYWKPHCYDSNYRACSRTNYFARYLLEASLLRFQLQSVQSNRLFRKVFTGSLIVTIPNPERAVEPTISQCTYWKPHCYDSNSRACSQTDYFARYLLEASLLRFQLQSVQSNELFRKVLTGSLIVTIPTPERAVKPTISQGTYWKPHCYDSNSRACSQTDYFARYLLEASLLRFQLQSVQSNELFRKVLTGSLIVTIPTPERAVKPTISQGIYWKPHCYDSNSRACSRTNYFARYLLEASLLRFQLQSVQSNRLFRKVLTGSLIVTIPTTERAVEPTISQGTYWKPHCYDSNYRACSRTDYFASSSAREREMRTAFPRRRQQAATGKTRHGRRGVAKGREVCLSRTRSHNKALQACKQCEQTSLAPPTSSLSLSLPLSISGRDEHHPESISNPDTE
ncbi:hypothetical protein PR048_024215 [Dryococelus australis]|uniref:Uncharacterized protein n=1 Tax=Dryococelus australis TaxID=614101 RepID=A0ABQ9GN04_9NEOP|nr:hypothetical protein PR048_024215 [Dryococelus australis]